MSRQVLPQFYITKCSQRLKTLENFHNFCILFFTLKFTKLIFHSPEETRKPEADLNSGFITPMRPLTIGENGLFSSDLSVHHYIQVLFQETFCLLIGSSRLLAPST